MNKGLYCSCIAQTLEQAMTAFSQGMEPQPPASCLHILTAKLFEASETIGDYEFYNIDLPIFI